MASLSFYDEHLAWQQRVGKELQSQTQFFRYRDSQRESNNSGFSYQPYRIARTPGRHNNTVDRLLKTSQPGPRNRQSQSAFPSLQEFNSVNVFAEVRGKYARPAPLLNKTPVIYNPHSTRSSYRRKSTRESRREQMIAYRDNQENSIVYDDYERVYRESENLRQHRTRSVAEKRPFRSPEKQSRPVTQHSVPNNVPKQNLFNQKPVKESQKDRLRQKLPASKTPKPRDNPQQPQDIPEIPEGKSKKIRAQNTEKAQPDIDEGEKQEEQNEQSEEDEKKAQEENEELDNTIAEIEELQSTRTTASQREYIEKLKSLLIQERKRRLKAEAFAKRLKKEVTQYASQIFVKNEQVDDLYTWGLFPSGYYYVNGVI